MASQRDAAPSRRRRRVKSRRRAKRAPDQAPGRPGTGNGRMPEFIEPPLCRLLPRPPEDGGWAHEIKFDGYRLQLRVEGGTRRAADPQGAGLDGAVRGHRPRGRGAAGLHLDGEAVALDQTARPDFSALQAALSERPGRRPDVLRLRPAVPRGRGPAAAAAARAQGASSQGCWSRCRRRAAQRLRYRRAFHAAPATRCCESACRMSLEGIVSKRLERPIGRAAAEAGSSRSAAPAMRW